MKWKYHKGERLIRLNNFQKVINYTTRILKQPITMMKKATAYKCDISFNNVYSNSSDIDFNNVYAEYNYSSLTI